MPRPARRHGRRTPLNDQIENPVCDCFDSTGTALQDVAVASIAYERGARTSRPQ